MFHRHLDVKGSGRFSAPQLALRLELSSSGAAIRLVRELEVSAARLGGFGNWLLPPLCGDPPAIFDALTVGMLLPVVGEASTTTTATTIALAEAAIGVGPRLLAFGIVSHLVSR